MRDTAQAASTNDAAELAAPAAWAGSVKQAMSSRPAAQRNRHIIIATFAMVQINLIRFCGAIVAHRCERDKKTARKGAERENDSYGQGDASPPSYLLGLCPSFFLLITPVE